jgi:hypothetical protein
MAARSAFRSTTCSLAVSWKLNPSRRISAPVLVLNHRKNTDVAPITTTRATNASRTAPMLSPKRGTDAGRSS